MKAYYEHREQMLVRYLFNVLRGCVQATAQEIAKAIHDIGTLRRAQGKD
jgi:hypothetical protein